MKLLRSEFSEETKTYALNISHMSGINIIKETSMFRSNQAPAVRKVYRKHLQKNTEIVQTIVELGGYIMSGIMMTERLT